MEFTLRDLIYICVYLVLVVGAYKGFVYRIQKTEEVHQTIKNIIFLDKGGLNIVTNDTCKDRRDTIHSAIRREAQVTKEALDQIGCLTQNITRIMIHMNLEPIVVGRHDLEVK